MNHPTKTIWVTREGIRIRVRDMSDTHLVNTARMLLRAARHEQRTMPYPNLNGEMAQFCAEQDYDNFQAMTEEEIASENCPTFDRIMLEIEKRHLTVGGI